MADQPDKRRKAHGEEIDTSNGALFLRIVELERQVKYLMERERQLTLMSRDIPFRVGGSE